MPHASEIDTEPRTKRFTASPNLNSHNSHFCNSDHNDMPDLGYS